MSAVSLALKNSPKISDERKKQIAKVAQELGYIMDGRLSELMEHLRRSRSATALSNLAILVPELKKAELDKYRLIKEQYLGMVKEAKASGYEVDTFFLEELKARPQRIKGILNSRGIRGVAVLPFVGGVGTIDLDCTDFCVATCGYSIISPMMNRACPNYLQMMDEIIENVSSYGYQRIGLIMTYPKGGIGHKLFSSSYMYYSLMTDGEMRIPILRKREINRENVKAWLDEYKPDVVISAGDVYEIIESLGYSIPDDIGFASYDLSWDPCDAAGANHRHDLVGAHAIKLMLSDLHLNRPGVPEEPIVVTIDSHFKAGPTLRKVGPVRDIHVRAAVARDSEGSVKIVR